MGPWVWAPPFVAAFVAVLWIIIELTNLPEDPYLRMRFTVGNLYGKLHPRLCKQASLPLNRYPACYQNYAIPHDDDIYLLELANYFPAADNSKCGLCPTNHVLRVMHG